MTEPNNELSYASPAFLVAIRRAECIAASSEIGFCSLEPTLNPHAERLHEAMAVAIAKAIADEMAQARHDELAASDSLLAAAFAAGFVLFRSFCPRVRDGNERDGDEFGLSGLIVSCVRNGVAAAIKMQMRESP